MSSVIVRYELKPERLEEHLGLIKGVFEHLRATAPEGVHYGVMKSADGTHFTHVATYDSDEARSAASDNAAFKAFSADIGERCITPPGPVPQEVIEGFGIFGK